MLKAIAAGCLGDKTPERGGFYLRKGKEVSVIDTESGAYHPIARPAPIAFVEKMKSLNRVGKYADAMRVLENATGDDANRCRRVVLGYVSYGLGLVGEVARTPHDVDTIMSYGFNWAPPCVIVDLLGARRTVELLGKLKLHVPAAIENAARTDAKMFAGGVLEYGRTLVG
jgi:hypothetical protein